MEMEEEDGESADVVELKSNLERDECQFNERPAPTAIGIQWGRGFSLCWDSSLGSSNN